MLDSHPLRIRITVPQARQLATRLLELETVQSIELDGSDDLLLEVHHAKQFFASLTDVVKQQEVDVERLQVIDASTEAVFDYLMESATHPR